MVGRKFYPQPERCVWVFALEGESNVWMNLSSPTPLSSWDGLDHLVAWQIAAMK
jgi:hypothetical protein